MTDPFGSLPRPKSHGSGFSTTAITLALISSLSGVFAFVIGKGSGAPVTWNLAVTGAAAVAAIIYAALAKRRSEGRADVALSLASLSIVVSILVIVT